MSWSGQGVAGAEGQREAQGCEGRGTSRTEGVGRQTGVEAAGGSGAGVARFCVGLAG